MLKNKTKKSNLLFPGFAFCNKEQQNVKTTYIEEQGEQIEELFSMEEFESTHNWQKVVLQQIIKENTNGFFVTDLKRLQKLALNLYRYIQSNNDDLILCLKELISLSTIPFRKLSYGDDVRNFQHIGGYFSSLCPFLGLPYIELQIATAKAIYWFAQNCGPVNTSETSTLRKFFPSSDDNAKFCLIPSQLCVKSFIESFFETFNILLNKLITDDIYAHGFANDGNEDEQSDSDSNKEAVLQDVLTLCFKSLFEFVVRGQSVHIPEHIVSTLIEFMSKKSEISILGNNGKKCSTRVLVHSLLFFNSFIQENPKAMETCYTQISALWLLFVEALFLSYKNAQRELRNEILGIIMMTIIAMPKSSMDRDLCKKMFNMLQIVARFELDKNIKLSYPNSFTDRNIRINHDDVDIEMLLLSQDLILVIKQKQDPPCVSEEFIVHQINILRNGVNRYMKKHSKKFSIHAIQLLDTLVHESRDLNIFIQKGGVEVVINTIKVEKDQDIIIHSLFLALKLHTIFANKEFVKVLMDLPSDNEKIASIVISLLSRIMEHNKELISVFSELNGITFLHSFFKNLSIVDFTDDSCDINPEFIIACIDCIRCICQQKFNQISQEFVYILLDCANKSPHLIRYAFVGLFLDMLKFPSFKNAALTWHSLPNIKGNVKKTSGNIQRTIIRWWCEEEKRLGINYDKCIIIDNDHPLDGHPLTEKAIQADKSNVKWILNRNEIERPNKPYKLDFRSRLHLMLKEFPEIKPSECKPKERIKELMIRSYQELKEGSIWCNIKEQLNEDGVKPLHDDRDRIENKIAKMREYSSDVQEKQCEIWQKCENERLEHEKVIYAQLSEGIKTAQFVAENYKAIINSQPRVTSGQFQGRTVKGEDILVKTGNLRSTNKQDINSDNDEDNDSNPAFREKVLGENYINNCLKDESISYLVQLMKKSKQNVNDLETISEPISEGTKENITFVLEET